jgi:uncharacterized protein DUF6916
MSPNRRRFLMAGATAALVAGIPTKLIFGKGAGAALTDFHTGPDMPVSGPLTRSSFERYVNSVFDVRIKRGGFTRSVPVTLMRVAGSGYGRKPFRSTKTISDGVVDENSFSLLFRGSLRTPIDQDVYDIRHPAVGTMNVLMVRVVNRDRKRGYYEVIFNRLRA